MFDCNSLTLFQFPEVPRTRTLLTTVSPTATTPMDALMYRTSQALQAHATRRAASPRFVKTIISSVLVNSLNAQRPQSSSFTVSVWFVVPQRPRRSKSVESTVPTSPTVRGTPLRHRRPHLPSFATPLRKYFSGFNECTLIIVQHDDSCRPRHYHQDCLHDCCNNNYRHRRCYGHTDFANHNHHMPYDYQTCGTLSEDPVPATRFTWKSRQSKIQVAP
jgi:hypothetical protein